MYGIIVVGHGRFAQGLISSINLILGEQPCLEGIEFNEKDSSWILEEKIIETMNNMKETSGIIFLTDLIGGTPFKICAILSENIKKSKVIAGTNLPLLIEILMNRELELINKIIEKGLYTGKEGIASFNNAISNKKNIKREDGI
ncbi:PTS sugar transporter subunit IIA [Tissierella sp. MSJ-40]|uniref:PTS sugar transporter subunit IIA n=1 Tax=Tissierella simiarum TaxID=2841534 RepID=A0ABS6E4V9_9FIRM|nr:PTS galactosamine/N-acetylgalactosamine transporter subunit IIA [Tissierella simiarum]MBU5437954.1 PTS sugar transporter subunit IIA [Tissierella simiarum]